MTAVDTLITQLEQNSIYLNEGPVVCAINTLIAALQQLQAGSGSVSVTDGVTTVNPASTIDFTNGVTVTDAGGGTADVAINFPAGPAGANPSATASDVAVNGVAGTFMRSDAAPAVQKATAAQFGLVKPDGVTITFTAGNQIQASATTGNWNLPVTLVGTSNYTFEQAPTFSVSEVLLQNNNAGVNTLAMQNINTGGFSTLSFRGDDNVEHCAIGYGNSLTGAPWQGNTYWEISFYNGTKNGTPPNGIIVQTGTLAGQAAASYIRQQFTAADASINFYEKDGVTPRLALQEGGLMLRTNGLTAQANVSEGNAFMVQNLHSHGYSTSRYLDNLGAEKLVVGHGNPTTTNFANTNFILTDAINLRFINFVNPTLHDVCGIDGTNSFWNFTPSTPATSDAAGVAGDIQVDANFIYVCTAANTWKRAALTAF